MSKTSKKFVSDHPLLLSQWHSTKNIGLKPSEVGSNSSSRIWWKCDKGEDHEWQAQPYNRTKYGSGCPFCAGQRATTLNNLAVSRPELLPVWDYEANKKLPTELMASSNYVAHFKCSENPTHKWQQKLSKKTVECPECFADMRSIFGMAPQLKEEWDFEENEALSLDPKKLPGGSGRKAAWICSKDNSHRWTTVIRNRVLLETGCPYCAGQIATTYSNLLVDAPEIALEWHPTKNGDTRPTDVKAGSGIKRWWLCPKGHSYQTSPGARTGAKGTGCPTCSPSTSSPEIRVFCELSYLFPDAQQRAKLEGVELDVWVPSLDMGVEYDGAHWHRNKQKSDARKNQILELAGIKLLRIRVKPLKKLRPHDVLCEKDDLTKEDIHALLNSMLQLRLITEDRVRSYEQQSDFLNDNEYRRILSYLPSPVPQLGYGLQ